MNYAPKPYYRSANRKRQIVDSMLAELYEMHEKVLEDALSYSDYSESKAILEYIMEKK